MGCAADLAQSLARDFAFWIVGFPRNSALLTELGVYGRFQLAKLDVEGADAGGTVSVRSSKSDEGFSCTGAMAKTFVLLRKRLWTD